MGPNAGAAIGGLFMFFIIAVYIALIVFSVVMMFRFVRATERIASAQERRASVAERTGQP